jgi:hypothetical protein
LTAFEYLFLEEISVLAMLPQLLKTWFLEVGAIVPLIGAGKYEDGGCGMRPKKHF